MKNNITSEVLVVAIVTSAFLLFHLGNWLAKKLQNVSYVDILLIICIVGGPTCIGYGIGRWAQWCWTVPDVPYNRPLIEGLTFLFMGFGLLILSVATNGLSK